MSSRTLVSPWDTPFGVNYVAPDELTELIAQLTECGYLPLTFDGSAIVDRLSLFAEARKQLPMGVASHSQEADWLKPVHWNWDAFVDFFVEGCYETGANRIAVLWRPIESLLKHDFQTFLEGVAVFNQISDSLQNRPLGDADDHEIELRVFLT